VTFSPASLLDRLGELETTSNKPERYVIALSGGLDSTVLAAALALTREVHGKALLAVHVDHQLQAESAAWSDHCRDLADGLDIDFTTRRVDVDPNSGSGLEAAARAARYKALAEHLRSGDWLLSAHHRDDQAETLLLNLMRGSGPAGIAGIGLINPFGHGWLVRPLIDVSRTALEEYAADAKLTWVEDPSNEDRRFDRNYLRHEILLRLEQRWPGVTRRLAKSASLAGEAATLLTNLADLDLRSIGDRPDRIDIDGLLALSEARQRNLLRHAIRQTGLPSPPTAQLNAVLLEVVTAKEDARPLVTWPGAEARRYRGKLYVLPADGEAALVTEPQCFGSSPLELADGLGTLELAPGAAPGLSQAIIEQGLTVHYRKGGEEIQPVGHTHTRKLKKLLQEEGVVPWMRERIPLVYSGDELVAVADLWIAAGAASSPGTGVQWKSRPALH
jgi:tRNA(Ile)-lysidine synthase